MRGTRAAAALLPAVLIGLPALGAPTAAEPDMKRGNSELDEAVRDREETGEVVSRPWAGYQVTVGTARVPFLGEVETRVVTRYLGRRTDTSEGVILEYRACSVDFSEVAGVKTVLAPSTLRRLPEDRVLFRQGEDGSWRAGPWRSGWGEEDVDDDGEPGATVRVEAPLCGGRLQVTSDTFSKARARISPTRIEGKIRVRVDQEILGASNACLRLTASDRVEQLRGWFVWVPVEEGATCRSLREEGWPEALRDPEPVS